MYFKHTEIEVNENVTTVKTSEIFSQEDQLPREIVDSTARFSVNAPEMYLTLPSQK